MATHSCDIQAGTLLLQSTGQTSEEALAFQLLARSAGACVFPHICTVSQLQATASILHHPAHCSVPTTPGSTGLSVKMTWTSICLTQVLIINDHHCFRVNLFQCVLLKNNRFLYSQGSVILRAIKSIHLLLITYCIRHFSNCETSHVWYLKHNC